MDHAAASTRLQSIAAQKMKGVVHEEEYGDPRDGMTASDLDSSSSLGRHDHSPRYSDLSASIPSDGDDVRIVAQEGGVELGLFQISI